MRKNEREERHRASSGSHSIAAWNSGAGPCWKQELGTQRRVPTWVAGMQGPEPSPLASGCALGISFFYA